MQTENLARFVRAQPKSALARNPSHDIRSRAISRFANQAYKRLHSYFRAYRRVWRDENFLAVGTLSRCTQAAAKWLAGNLRSNKVARPVGYAAKPRSQEIGGRNRVSLAARGNTTQFLVSLVQAAQTFGAARAE